VRDGEIEALCLCGGDGSEGVGSCCDEVVKVGSAAYMYLPSSSDKCGSIAVLRQQARLVGCKQQH